MFRKVGGVFLALIGVIGCGLSLHFLWDEIVLDVTGREISGVVTAKSIEEDEDHHDHPYLYYRYDDANGQEHTAKSDCFQSMYDRYPVGSVIPVVFSPSFPTISRIRAAGGGLLPAGACAVAGVGFLWWGVWTIRRQIYWENKLARLTEKGERVVGRLVAVEEDTTETNEDPPKVLVYAFTDKTGQERTGKTFHVKGRDHAFWESRIGSALDIRVNPADPTDHIALIEESKLLG